MSLNLSDRNGFCYRCGELISIEDRFCDQCGAIQHPPENSNKGWFIHNVPVLIMGIIFVVTPIVLCAMAIIIEAWIG